MKVLVWWCGDVVVGDTWNRRTGCNASMNYP